MRIKVNRTIGAFVLMLGLQRVPIAMAQATPANPLTAADSAKAKAKADSITKAEVDSAKKKVDAEPLYKFSNDYDIPESPGFAVLGATPSSVLRGSAAKPIVTSLVSQIVSGQKLKSGIAVDFAPFFVFGGTFANVRDYATNPWKRALGNAQFSFATIQSQTDTMSVSFGAGLRMNLKDPHDLVLYKDLVDKLVESVVSCAKAPPGGAAVRAAQTGTEVGAPRHCDGLEQAYKAAKDSALGMKGALLAIGGGAAGLLHGSVVSNDSLADRRGRVWLSGGYSFGRRTDILAIVTLQDSATTGWTMKGGIAARGKFPTSEFGVELSYDGAAKTWQPGGAAEWRVIPGVWVIAGIGADNVVIDGKSVQKVRFRTSLRWNGSATAP